MQGKEGAVQGKEDEVRFWTVKVQVKAVEGQVYLSKMSVI